jgi:hypothetical protein
MLVERPYCVLLMHDVLFASCWVAARGWWCLTVATVKGVYSQSLQRCMCPLI